MYIVEDSEEGMSLARKLAEAKPNGIIPLTHGEMEVLNRGGFQTISNENNPFVKLDPNSKYIFFADDRACTDDVFACSKYLGIDIGIIRTGLAG